MCKVVVLTLPFPQATPCPSHTTCMDGRFCSLLILAFIFHFVVHFQVLLEYLPPVVGHLPSTVVMLYGIVGQG